MGPAQAQRVNAARPSKIQSGEACPSFATLKTPLQTHTISQPVGGASFAMAGHADGAAGVGLAQESGKHSTTRPTRGHPMRIVAGDTLDAGAIGSQLCRRWTMPPWLVNSVGRSGRPRPATKPSLPRSPRRKRYYSCAPDAVAPCTIMRLPSSSLRRRNTSIFRNKLSVTYRRFASSMASDPISE